MRKLPLLIIIILINLICKAQTPTVEQIVQATVVNSGSAITDLYNCNCIKQKLGSNSIIGNGVIVGVAWGDTSQTPTLSDNNGDSYIQQVLVTNSIDNNAIGIWTTHLSFAGITNIKIQFTSYPGHLSYDMLEVKNIGSTIVVRNTCTGNNTNGPTGTITCSSAIGANTDFVYQFGIPQSSVGPQHVTAFTAGTSFTKVGSDRMSAVDQHMSQYQVVAGAVTPSFTYTSSTLIGYLTAGIAIEAGSAGGDLAAGAKVLAMLTNGDDNATGETSPFTIDAPCPAATDTIASAWVGASGGLTSLVGSSSGTHTAETSNAVNGASGTLRLFLQHVAAGSPNDVITVTTSAATSSGDTLVLLCLQGMANPAFDNAQSDNTHTGSNVQFTLFPSITPATSNGIIFGAVGVQSNNLDASQAQVGSTVINWPAQDENNNWLFYYNPNTSSVSFKVTPNPSATVNNYTAQFMALKAAPVGTFVPQIGGMLIQ